MLILARFQKFLGKSKVIIFFFLNYTMLWAQNFVHDCWKKNCHTSFGSMPKLKFRQTRHASRGLPNWKPVLRLPVDFAGIPWLLRLPPLILVSTAISRGNVRVATRDGERKVDRNGPYRKYQWDPVPTSCFGNFPIGAKDKEHRIDRC